MDSLAFSHSCLVGLREVAGVEEIGNGLATGLIHVVDGIVGGHVAFAKCGVIRDPR